MKNAARGLLPISYAFLLALALPACGGCGDDPGGNNGDDDAGMTGDDSGDDAGPVADAGPLDGSDNDGGGDNDGAPNDTGGSGDAGRPDTGADPNNQNNANLDTDCDGLSDAEEFSIIYPSGLHTDPSNPDSDGDGIPDGLEVGRTLPIGTTACVIAADTDPGTTTDPTRADSDGDGISDGVEDHDHNGALGTDESNPRASDTDGDGIPDNIEDANRDGVRDAGETHPNRRDSDGDGIGDGIEDENHNGGVDSGETDPRNPDSDGDGLPDGTEDSNHNGNTEPFETNPLSTDTDCDGISDGEEITIGTSPLVPDTDGDGITDGVEMGRTAVLAGSGCPGTMAIDQDPNTMTDPLDIDSDGDGLADGVEDANQNGRVDPGETDPGDADTDGDGLPDGDEVLAGFDPLDPTDPPPGSVPGIIQICGTANLRVVNFNVGGPDAWTVASETSFAYTPVTTTAGSNVDVAALDDGGNAISGFVLRMPLLAGNPTITDQATALAARLSAGAAGQGLTYALRLSGRNITSHDGFTTSVSTVVDFNVSTGTLNASAVRNLLVNLTTGLTAGDFTGLPTTTGAAGAQYTFGYQVLLRDTPQELIVIGGLLDRASFNTVSDNRSILIADLTNGTALARANAPRSKDCDPFTATGQSVADFIWMADISSSTDDDRGNISTAASLIVTALTNNGVDFRMGVVPHTQNRFRFPANNGNLRAPGFVRNPATFAANLLDTSGTDGCEFGLDAADRAIVRALPRTAPGVEDAFRLRDNAVLAVVYISDEFAQELNSSTVQACSGYNTPCATGVGDYYAASNNAVCTTVPNAAQQTCINSIAAPYINTITSNNGVAFAQVIVPNGNTSCTGYACPGGQPANEPGRGYVEVVNATGGAFYTPCSNNPGAALQAIVDAIAGAASQFTLTGPPISSTIKVGIVRQGTGTVIEVLRDKDDGFDYDAASNSIFFRGFTARPNQGDLVVISYRNWRPPTDPCGPCLASQICDPQLGVCTCDAAVCNACGPNEICDAACQCVCAPDCNGQCGLGEVCNPLSCACECDANCGGACGPGQVCNQTSCTCDCDANCGGACAGTNLVCNQGACNCQCPTDCGGACTGNTVCNPSTCGCACGTGCDQACPGNSVCDPAQNCGCACPNDCGGCPDGTTCNQTSCACECGASCDDACPNRAVCDPNNGCGCFCPAACGGCNANETCDQANCRCVPIV